MCGALRFRVFQCIPLLGFRISALGCGEYLEYGVQGSDA